MFLRIAPGDFSVPTTMPLANLRGIMFDCRFGEVDEWSIGRVLRKTNFKYLHGPSVFGAN